MSEFIIPADLDVGMASKVHSALSGWVGSIDAGQSAELELSEPMPTQISLQLLIAGARALQGKDVTLSLGEHAAATMAAETKAEGQ